MAQAALLGLLKVAQQRAQRPHGRRLLPSPASRSAARKLLAGTGSAALCDRARSRSRRSQPVARSAGAPATSSVLASRRRRVVERAPPGAEAAQLVVDALARRLPASRQVAGLAGGDVGRSIAQRAVLAMNSGADVVVLPLLQHGRSSMTVPGVTIRMMSRFTSPLAVAGILHLLADGHLVALGDQPGDVGSRSAW